MEYFKIFKSFSLSFVFIGECLQPHTFMSSLKPTSFLKSIFNAIYSDNTEKKNFFNKKMPRYLILEFLTIII